MTVTVTRETEYHGEPIREQHTVTADGTECRLRVLPDEERIELGTEEQT